MDNYSRPPLAKAFASDLSAARLVDSDRTSRFDQPSVVADLPRGCSTLTGRAVDAGGQGGVAADSFAAVGGWTPRDVMAGASVALKMLRHLPQPMLIVDHDLTVRFANEAAHVFLADGSILSHTSGRLEFADNATIQALAGVITSLDKRTDPGPCHSTGIQLPMTTPGKKLVATMQRFTESTEPGAEFGDMSVSKLYLVALHQLGQPHQIDWRLLGRAMGLTRAEAQVGALLAQGMMPDEIASSRQVSVDTVRVQLRCLYSKTGTTRQADLVREIVGFAALQPAGESN